jgi:hypothetical protein
VTRCASLAFGDFLRARRASIAHAAGVGLARQDGTTTTAGARAAAAASAAARAARSGGGGTSPAACWLCMSWRVTTHSTLAGCWQRTHTQQPRPRVIRHETHLSTAAARAARSGGGGTGRTWLCTAVARGGAQRPHRAVAAHAHTAAAASCYSARGAPACGGCENSTWRWRRHFSVRGCALSWRVAAHSTLTGRWSSARTHSGHGLEAPGGTGRTCLRRLREQHVALAAAPAARGYALSWRVAAHSALAGRWHFDHDTE